MNDALRIQLSAFLDGELPARETELLLRRLGQDTDLQREAERYYAIGQSMRGERRLPGVTGMRERIAAALEHEPGQDTGFAAGSRWQRPAAGVAIAASVALLALIGLRQANLPDDAATLTASNAGVAIDDTAGYTEPAASDVMSDRPSEMLMQYYLSHGETSSELGANGILSRLVTLELRGGEHVEVAAEDDALAEESEDTDNSTESTLPRE